MLRPDLSTRAATARAVGAECSGLDWELSPLGDMYFMVQMQTLCVQSPEVCVGEDVNVCV